MKVVPLFLGLAASAASLSAQVAPLSQARSVDAGSAAEVRGDSDAQTDGATAPDFGPFNAAVSPLSVAVAGSDVAIGQGSAGQQSTLGPNVVSVSGGANVSLTILPAGGASASGRGESLFDFEFSLAEQHHFSLLGSVDTLAILTGGASVPALANSVRLLDVDNALVLFETLTDDENFSVAGLLDAGRYRLLASASAEGTEVAGQGSRTVNALSAFDFSLTVQPVPEPAAAGAAIVLMTLGAQAAMRRRRAGN